MDTSRAIPAEVNTLVVGGGQAGLAMSYWLGRAGVEHQVLERRASLGGGWQDRWDAFCLNTPNLSLALPGMPYAGPDPDAFMPRDDVVDYFRQYARTIGAPVRTDTDVTRIAAADGGAFDVETSQGAWRARNVVLATGGFQKAKIPPLSAQLPGHIVQLHTDDYRNPGQLPAGAVLIVGTGQSGGQIAEELLAAGREVHLAVSTCPEAPRRYRGRDIFDWLMQLGMHGHEYGFNAPTPEQLPSPALRFACNPLLTGADGGHDIHLRDLGRRGVRLHGHLEAADDGVLTFTDDLPQRLARVESGFGQRMGPMLDAFIAAAGIDAPPAEPRAADGLAAVGTGAAEPGSGGNHHGPVGHRLPARLQHPGHPRAGRVELPPPQPRRHRTPRPLRLGPAMAYRAGLGTGGRRGAGRGVHCRSDRG